MAKFLFVISSISFPIATVFLGKFFFFSVDTQGHFSESLPNLHWPFASRMDGTDQQPKISPPDLHGKKGKATLSLAAQAALGVLYCYEHFESGKSRI